MAPPSARHRTKPKPQLLNRYMSVSKKFLLDPEHLGPVCLFLFLGEAICNVLIIENVKYTEIDWNAYMQQVEGFLNGTLDYQYLKGDTGPLVYPAGHLYIFTALYYVTNYGRNIYLGQYIYLVLYLIQTVMIHRIYRITAKVPPYALILATLTSYRIHSIYVLRLFNDPIAVLLFYMSLNLFVMHKWKLGSLFFSLAVSVKMNILLYAPCLLVAYLTNLTYKQTFVNLFICGFVQLVLGLPFLLTNPLSYIRCSFNLGRVFEHQWTVNYRFLDQSIFEHKYFHITLLVAHIILLIVYLPLLRRCLSGYARLTMVMTVFKQVAKGSKKKQENVQEVAGKVAQLFVLPFFLTNLIGIACARSIHYQFYAWYYHSLLYLAFSTKYSKPTRFLILAVMEYCYKTYPSTNLSSVLLHVCHILLLVGVFKNVDIL